MTLMQWFTTREKCWQCLKIFLIGCYRWGGDPGILWVEVSEATKEPRTHRTVPITENYPAHQVSGTEVEPLLQCAKVH